MLKTVIAVLCCSFVLRAWELCSPENELHDDQFFDLVVNEHFENASLKVIALECADPKDNATCLYIIDRIGYFEDGSWFVGRFVAPVPDLTRGFLSVSKLLKPVFKSKNSIDTSNWLVDVGIMDPSTPNGFEFVSLFKLGIFAPSENISGDVRFIGVATGGLMSFMAHHFKNLNFDGVDIDPHSEYLAKKWFGYTDRENSRIGIMDGALYIKNMAERGETSDAVLVDACHNNEPKDGVYCPVEPIRTPEFLENLSKVIGKRGMTIFNVYSRKKGLYRELLSSFLEHFEHCRMFGAERMVGNVFMVCSNSDWTKNRVNHREVEAFLTKLRMQKFMRFLF